MRLALIYCGVLSDEVQHFVQGLPHICHIRRLDQGLHHQPDRLRQVVQEQIDEMESTLQVDAIALGYGLCSRGTEGLRTRWAQLVLPRAHDCITIFLGSKERYQRLQEELPGSYWYSPGWNATLTQPGPDRDAWERARYQALCEDEADLQDMLAYERQWMQHYQRVAYVDLGAGDCQAACAYAQNCARHVGWEFVSVPGDPSLLRDLLLGHWDAERFLVCAPGWTARFTGDARVVEAVPCPADDA